MNPVITKSLVPVVVLLVIGRLLVRFGLADRDFFSKSDRLIYYIFFPLLLFWKIGGARPATSADVSFCLAVIMALILMFGLSLVLISLLRVPRVKAGAFSQCFYRFNSYIGMAVFLSVMGDNGVRHFGILIGFAIPMLNLFSVLVLVANSQKTIEQRSRSRVIALALVSNPLIIASLAGILYARYINIFPPAIESSLRLASSLSLPMALLSIGAGLSAEGISENMGLALVAAVGKLLILPVAGYLLLKWLGVGREMMTAGMIFLALPTSPAIYVLSGQLGSDTGLASASITLSTLLSFVSLTCVLFLFA